MNVFSIWTKNHLCKHVMPTKSGVKDEVEKVDRSTAGFPMLLAEPVELQSFILIGQRIVNRGEHTRTTHCACWT